MGRRVITEDEGELKSISRNFSVIAGRCLNCDRPGMRSSPEILNKILRKNIQKSLSLLQSGYNGESQLFSPEDG